MAHYREKKAKCTISVRRRPTVLSIAIFLLFAASAGVSLAAEGLPALSSSLTERHVEVPGLGAYFIPAKSLDISEKFDGFASEERGLEIVVAVIASPYATIEESFNENTLKSRGVNLLSKAAFTLNGSPATLMKALHPDGGRNWGKWILLLDGGDRTLVANGVFVSGDEDAATDVEAMLKSVVFRPQGVQRSQAPNESVLGINPE